MSKCTNLSLSQTVCLVLGLQQTKQHRFLAVAKLRELDLVPIHAAVANSLLPSLVSRTVQEINPFMQTIMIVFLVSLIGLWSTLTYSVDQSGDFSFCFTCSIAPSTVVSNGSLTLYLRPVNTKVKIAFFTCSLRNL